MTNKKSKGNSRFPAGMEKEEEQVQTQIPFGNDNQQGGRGRFYSTVTLFARFLGWSPLEAIREW